MCILNDVTVKAAFFHYLVCNLVLFLDYFFKSKQYFLLFFMSFDFK